MDEEEVDADEAGQEEGTVVMGNPGEPETVDFSITLFLLLLSIEGSPFDPNWLLFFFSLALFDSLLA